MDAFLDQFFNKAVMVKYLPDVIGGLWVTLALAGSVIVTGVFLGLALSCLRSFQIRWINWGIVLLVSGGIVILTAWGITTENNV